MARLTKIALVALTCLLASPAAVSREPGASAPGGATTPAVPIMLLVDLTSGAELLARNPDHRFVPASITKVMTLFVAFELIAEGQLREDQAFPISDGAFRAWRQKGSTMFIEAGSTVRVSDLLTGIANVSANDGAIVLSEGAAGSVERWVALMNRKARELGMHNSHFGTPNGWADGGRTFTTAHDLAILARAMIERHPELYARYIGHPGFTYNGITQPNHDPLIGRTPGADGIKTGYTGEAGYGFLGSVERGGRRLVLVVAAADSKSARDTAARRLAEWGFATTDTRTLFGAGERIASVQVQGGDALTVPVVAGTLPVMATVPRSGEARMALSVYYEGPLKAPIQAGERIAQLEIRVDGMPPSRIPLYAGYAVETAGPLDRLRNGMAGLFRW